MTQQAKMATLPAERWAYVACRSGLQPSEISATIESAFAELAEAIARGGVRTEALRTQIYWPINERVAISQHLGGSSS